MTIEGRGHAWLLSGGPVVRDAASSPAITQRPLAASPRHGPGRRSASELGVWMTAAPARPHGHSGGRVEEHLCGPTPRIGQDMELGGGAALVRPISRRPASRPWSARKLATVRWTFRQVASGIRMLASCPVSASARSIRAHTLLRLSRYRLVRGVGRGRITSSQAVAIDVGDAARHPSVIHARSAVGAGQGQTDHLCHSKPEQVAHERPLRCSVTLCMAAGWERFPWLPIVD